MAEQAVKQEVIGRKPVTFEKVELFLPGTQEFEDVQERLKSSKIEGKPVPFPEPFLSHRFLYIVYNDRIIAAYIVEDGAQGEQYYHGREPDAEDLPLLISGLEKELNGAEQELKDLHALVTDGIVVQNFFFNRGTYYIGETKYLVFGHSNLARKLPGVSDYFEFMHDVGYGGPEIAENLKKLSGNIPHEGSNNGGLGKAEGHYAYAHGPTLQIALGHAVQLYKLVPQVEQILKG